MRDELLRLCRDYVNYSDLMLYHQGSAELGTLYAARSMRAHCELVHKFGLIDDLYTWCRTQIAAAKRVGRLPWKVSWRQKRRRKRAQRLQERRFRWHVTEFVPTSGGGPYYQVGWVSKRRCYPKWTGRVDRVRVTSFEDWEQENEE